MRQRKLLTILFIAVLALALTGCGDKDEKRERKTETTEDIGLDLFGDVDGPETPDVNEPDGDYDSWITGGSDLTGYAEVPADWEYHEATEGDKVAHQYFTYNQDGLVSFIYNQPSPSGDGVTAEMVLQVYVDEYAKSQGTNLGTDEIELDGEPVMRSLDCLPEGAYKDYDYYVYTYVSKKDGIFYIVSIEGREDIIAEVVERFEETFEYPYDNNFDDEDTDDDENGGLGETTLNEGDYFKVTVCGDTYFLPCDFSEMAANGWVIDDYYSEDMLDTDDYSFVEIENGDISATVILANLYGEPTVSCDNAQVVGVVIDDTLEGTDSCITYEVSLGTSYSDVIAALGQPTDIYEDDEEDYKVLTYEGPDYEYDYFSCIEITLRDGAVEKIDIRHWSLKEEK